VASNQCGEQWFSLPALVSLFSPELSLSRAIKAGNCTLKDWQFSLFFSNASLLQLF
jgi:hypothetical protein